MANGVAYMREVSYLETLEKIVVRRQNAGGGDAIGEVGMNLGAPVGLVAEGLDGDGNPVPIAPSWVAEPAELLKVASGPGSAATVTGARPGQGKLVVGQGECQATVAVTVYVLAEIVLWKGEAAGPRVETGGGETLNVGGQIVLTAQGRDNSGALVSGEISWKAEHPHIVQVTPLGQSMAVVRGVRSGSSKLIVQSEGVQTSLLLLVH